MEEMFSDLQSDIAKTLYLIVYHCMDLIMYSALNVLFTTPQKMDGEYLKCRKLLWFNKKQAKLKSERCLAKLKQHKNGPKNFCLFNAVWCLY